MEASLGEHSFDSAGVPIRYVESYGELLAVLPRMRLVVIEGADHPSAGRRPEFLEALQTFLGANG